MSSIIADFIVSSILGDIIVSYGPIKGLKKYVEKILGYKQINDVIKKTQSDMAREGFSDYVLSEIFTEVDLSSEQRINQTLLLFLEENNIDGLFNYLQHLLRLKFCGSGVNLQKEEINNFATRLLNYLHKNILQSDLRDIYKINVLDSRVNQLNSKTMEIQEQVLQFNNKIKSLESLISSPKVIETVFTVPFFRDNYFVGRLEFLEEVFTLIQDEQIINIYGLAGIGKSSTALELCFKFKEEFKRILWVNIESGLLNGISTISRQLGLLQENPIFDSVDETLATKFVNLLRAESNRDTLIIIDGFDNIDFGKSFDNDNKSWEICNGISLFNINAKIVILSRRKLTNRAFHPKKLDILDSKSEKKLLNVEDDEDAKKLAHALYHIPLYLRVTRVLIDKHILSVTEILENLDKFDSLLENSYTSTSEIGYDKCNLTWNYLFKWYWKLISSDKQLKHLVTKIACFGNEVSVPLQRIALLSSEGPFLCSAMLHYLHEFSLFSILTNSEVRLHSLIQKEILKLSNSQPIYKKEYQSFSEYYEEPNLLALELLSRNAQSIIRDIVTTHKVIEKSKNSRVVISEELNQIVNILSNIEYIISQCNQNIDVIQNIREEAYRLGQKIILNKYSKLLLQHEDSIITTDCKNILETVSASKYYGHSDAVRSFISWKDELISSSDDGHIYVWDLQDYSLKMDLHNHYSEIKQLKICDQYLVSIGHDQRLNIWNIESGCIERSITFGYQLSSLLIIDNSRFLIGTCEGILLLADMLTGEIYDQLELTTTTIGSLLQLCNHENTMLAGDYDGQIYLIKVDNESIIKLPVKSPRIHNDRIKGLIELEDKNIISVSYDNQIKKFSISDQNVNLLHHQTITDNWATCVAKMSHLLFIGSYDRKIKIFNTKNNLLIFETEEFPHGITGIYSNNGVVFVGLLDGSIYSLRIKKDGCDKELIARGRADIVCDIKNNKNNLSITSFNSMTTSWQIKGAELFIEKQLNTKGSRVSEYLNKGKTIITGSIYGNIEIWDEKVYPKKQKTFKTHQNQIWDLINQGNDTFWSSGFDERIMKWRLVKGNLIPLQTISFSDIKNEKEVNNFFWDFDLASNGNICVATETGHLIFLKNKNSQKMYFLKGHRDRIRCCKFNLEGDKIASGSDDNSIRLWDVATKECELVLTGHSDRVWGIEFLSEDRIISISHDHSIIIWDLLEGTMLSRLFLSKPLTAICLLEDYQLTVGDFQGNIRMLKINSYQGRYQQQL